MDITGFECQADSRLLRVFLNFPVTNMEFVLHDMEERLHYSHGELVDAVFKIVEHRLKEFGLAEVNETCAYGALSVLVELKPNAIEADVLQRISEGCRIFWGKYQLDRTKEIKARGLTRIPKSV